MPQFNSRTMANLTSVAANAAVNVADMETVKCWVLGTFVATIQMQVSPDGTNWVNSGSAVTAPAIIDVPTGVGYVRLNCTAFTSGTIVGKLTGVDEDRKG